MSERLPRERAKDEDKVVQSIQDRYERLSPHLDEKNRRRFAATEASALGHGGIVTVAQSTGLAEATIRRGR